MIVPWIDIAIAAYEAGFRGEDLAVAIALSQPESQRHSDAHNPEDPNGGSFGLIQINGVHDPDATGTAPNMVPTQAWIDKMFNPKENYKAGYQVYLRSGKSFNPWGTYTSGAYLLKWHDPVDVAKVAMDARARLATSETALKNARALLADSNKRIIFMQDELTLTRAERDRLLSELEVSRTAVSNLQLTITALENKISNARNALA